MAKIGLIMKYNWLNGKFEVINEKGVIKQEGTILSWTAIAIDEVTNQVLFYHKESGQCIVYEQSTDLKIVFNQTIDPGWTHIVYMKNTGMAFYNKASGRLYISSLNTRFKTKIDERAWEKGYTSVWPGSYTGALEFYNTATGDYNHYDMKVAGDNRDTLQSGISVITSLGNDATTVFYDTIGNDLVIFDWPIIPKWTPAKKAGFIATHIYLLPLKWTDFPQAGGFIEGILPEEFLPDSHPIPPSYVMQLPKNTKLENIGIVEFFLGPLSVVKTQTGLPNQQFATLMILDGLCEMLLEENGWLRINFLIKTGYEQFAIPTNLADGKVHHIAFNFKRRSWKLYIDGLSTTIVDLDHPNQNAILLDKTHPERNSIYILEKDLNAQRLLLQWFNWYIHCFISGDKQFSPGKFTSKDFNYDTYKAAIDKQWQLDGIEKMVGVTTTNYNSELSKYFTNADTAKTTYITNDVFNNIEINKITLFGNLPSAKDRNLSLTGKFAHPRFHLQYLKTLEDQLISPTAELINQRANAISTMKGKLDSKYEKPILPINQTKSFPILYKTPLQPKVIEFDIKLAGSFGVQPLITLVDAKKSIYVQISIVADEINQEAGINFYMEYKGNNSNDKKLFGNQRITGLDDGNWHHIQILFSELSPGGTTYLIIRANNQICGIPHGINGSGIPVFTISNTLLGDCEFGTWERNNISFINGLITPPVIWENTSGIADNLILIETVKRIDLFANSFLTTGIQPLINYSLLDAGSIDYILTIFPQFDGDASMISKLINGTNKIEQSSFVTPKDLLSEVQGNLNVSIEQIDLIDLWIKPQYRTAKNPKKDEIECIFEIAEGLEDGNLFGLYLVYGDSGEPHLAFRKNRVSEISTFQPVSTALEDNFNHLLIQVRKKEIQGYPDTYRVYEASVMLNGYRNVSPFTDAFDVLNDFIIRYISVGKSLYKFTGGSEAVCQGNIIGPRLWHNPGGLPLKDLWGFVPAYAYMYFKDDPAFGPLKYQQGAFGKLLGTVKEITYDTFELPAKPVTTKKVAIPNKNKGTITPKKLIAKSPFKEIVPIGTKSKTIWMGKNVKKNAVFFLYENFLGDITFSYDGNRFQQPEWQQWANGSVGKNVIETKLDLGQKIYPYPLEKIMVGYPNAMRFSNIKTIDFWMRYRQDELSDEQQMILQIDGMPSSGFLVTGISIILEKQMIPDENANAKVQKELKSLIIRKRFTDGSFTDVKMQYGQPDYLIPDLWNGKYHHLCFQSSDSINDNNYYLRINGNNPVFIGGNNYLRFDFQIKAIYAASNKTGGNRFTGELAGPRFWKGKSWDNATLYHAAFTNFDVPPDRHVFKHSKEIGRINYHLATEELNGYRKNGIIPASFFAGEKEKRGTGFEFHFSPRKPRVDKFIDYVGVWANQSNNYDYPVQMDLEAHNLGSVDHCIYNSTTFIYLTEDPKTHKLKIFTSGGKIFEMQHFEDNTATFVDPQETMPSSIQDKQPMQVCTVTFLKQPLQTQFVSNTNAPQYRYALYIQTSDNKKIETGLYNIPNRKPDWPKDELGNIFLHRPGNFDSMLMGYDITRIDPFILGNEGMTGKAIFRIPPPDSPWMDVHQGIAIPFGWHFIPFSSYSGKSSARFATSSESVESMTSEGFTHSLEQDDSTSFNVGLPDVGSEGTNIQEGTKSENNRETACRVKEIEENESFCSVSKWYSTSHDLVLDFANVLFAGEMTAYDNKYTMDQGSGFYWDLIRLKDVVNNESKEFINFIKLYGTHYIHSARFGSKGWKMHIFTADTVTKLRTNNFRIGTMNGSSNNTSFHLDAEIPTDGPSINVGGSNAHGVVDGNGNQITTEAANEIARLIKKEYEETGSRGSYSETGLDQAAEIHVYRHMRPIHTLLSPPFFADVELVTTIRQKLKKYTEQYISDQRKDFPKARFTTELDTFVVSISTKYLMSPTKLEILNSQPANLNDIPKKESNIIEYTGSVTLDIIFMGQTKKLIWVFDNESNDEVKTFEFIKRSKVYTNGQCSDPPALMECKAQTVLNARVKNHFEGSTHSDKVKHKNKEIIGALLGGWIGLYAMSKQKTHVSSDDNEAQVSSSSTLFNLQNIAGNTGKPISVNVDITKKIVTIGASDFDKYFNISVTMSKVDVSQIIS